MDKHVGLQHAAVHDVVSLHVSHSNLKHHSSQLRFDLHSTIESVKERLSRNSGTAVSVMLLQLFDDNDQKICNMTDNSRPLGFYSPMDGFRIHIVDLDPASFTANGWLEDTSLVEKYSITEEDYQSRPDSFRKFKEKKMAEDPTWNKSKMGPNYMEDMAVLIHVGDRCEIDPGGKRGTVLFVGQVEALAPGFWVGIQYDEPVGKHDGIMQQLWSEGGKQRARPTFGEACHLNQGVKGKRYFSCPDGHGAMVRPDKVKVGDYPELDPFDDVEEI